MSLLSTDITKVKRLSLKEITLPAPELRVDPITPLQVKRPPTDEEIAYSKLIESNPLIEELVEILDLVSYATGEEIRKVEAPIGAKITGYNEDVKEELRDLVKRIIDEGNSYTKDEIKERIRQATNVSQERVDRGFNLILLSGAIELTPENNYYLTGSSTNQINTVI